MEALSMEGLLSNGTSLNQTQVLLLTHPFALRKGAELPCSSPVLVQLIVQFLHLEIHLTLVGSLSIFISITRCISEGRLRC